MGYIMVNDYFPSSIRLSINENIIQSSSLLVLLLTFKIFNTLEKLPKGNSIQYYLCII